MTYEIEFHKIPAPIVIVRNWYSKEELKNIWEELKFLCNPFILKSSKERANGEALDNGVNFKKAYGIFLDDFFGSRRDNSVLLKICRKHFDKKFIEKLIQLDASYEYIMRIDYDGSLLNYYEKDDEYKFHHDKAVFTAISFFWKEPKMFSGGKLLFTEKDIDFNFNSGDLVIFPGYVLHRVTPTELNEGVESWACNGRFSFANFLTYRI